MSLGPNPSSRGSTIYGIDTHWCDAADCGNSYVQEAQLMFPFGRSAPYNAGVHRASGLGAGPH